MPRFKGTLFGQRPQSTSSESSARMARGRRTTVAASTLASLQYRRILPYCALLLAIAFGVLSTLWGLSEASR